MKQQIQLIALDLDGTLFNSRSTISQKNKEAIRQAQAQGVTIVISTGRPYIGMPLSEMENLGIRYGITANGAALYRVPEKELLFENALSWEESTVLLQELYQLSLHVDVFIDGMGYTQASTTDLIQHLDMPDSLKHYIRTSRNIVPDLPEYIRSNRLSVTKMTMNFAPDADGRFPTRDRAEAILKAHPEITYVSGGYHNLELTKKGVSKSEGLSFLCQMLSIPIENTLACGDSGNDLDIVRAAGIGVAMANAEAPLKEAADFISLSNEEDGVAYAIEKFVLKAGQ